MSQLPSMSAYFDRREPTAIRVAQIEFTKRTDGARSVCVAIGNVSLPMHPAMQKRAFNLKEGFPDGVVKYTLSRGTDECRAAFLNAIAASDCETKDLHVQITDGGSAAMEVVILGTCSKERPLMLIDPAYANYMDLAKRVGIPTMAISRTLQKNGKYTLPSIEEIDRRMAETKPGAIVVIPYDNPTGHYCDDKIMQEIAKLCVKHNIWMISDEAYRELYYTDGGSSSIWKLKESDVPGITGRRISIDSASKVWNACGLRIGALITDNQRFHEQGVAEYSSNLSANGIGQYIFGAIAHESKEDLKKWFKKQRDYYQGMMTQAANELRELMPGVVVSSPEASIYSVIEVKDIVKPGFNAKNFVLYCAQKGSIDLDGHKTTLLVAPMAGFCNPKPGEPNPGVTQMRIAYVCPPDEMKLVPRLFVELLRQYEAAR